VLAAAKNLISVGCFCIGTNQVDLDAAKSRGIPVFNAPFSNTRSVAELTIGSIIHLLRGIPEKNLKAHRGEWAKTAKNSFEARRKKLGIVGYGNIGSQLSILASGLGMHVYYYDIESKLSHGNAVPVDSLEELLKISDVVTLHVPALESTKNLMNATRFAQMKTGSFLINYARGNVVDIDALVENLESGKILGAALDVYPTEPKSNKDEFKSPLLAFDNVLLSPHIGGSTQEAQENIGREVAQKLVNFYKDGTTAWAVNFPEINVETLVKNSRILHVHNNIPGILGQINKIFLEKNINVEAQILKTDENIGVAVIDIAGELTSELLKNLSTISGTIRVRKI